MMNKKSRTAYLYFLVIVFTVLINNKVSASTLEKGNPVAYYYDNGIILPDNTSIDIDDDYIALFVNGTLVTDYDVIIRNNRALVPIRLISQELGCQVSWDKKSQTVTIEKDKNTICLTINKEKALVDNKEIAMDYPAILYNNATYVPIRFIVENLDATVTYAPKLNDEYTYYYDTQMPLSSANTIIRSYPNIIIDEKYDSDHVITKEEAMEKVQQTCMMGLENFKKTTIDNLIASGESSDRLDNEFKQIEKEINRMMYIGEVSRYYKFTIGAYDILFDKYNSKIFFEMYSSGIKVKEVDINDPALFISVFIVG